jgi:LacI family transcriptional regulator
MSIASRVTIRDIAREAHLHFTTVSLALRNSPRLKAETRKKIQKLAESMGYRPDPMLAALNAYRQTRQPVHYQATLAWIHNWPDPKNLYNCEEFNQYYLGACERARERGYNVEQFWLQEPGMSIEKLHRILRARNIQGALLAPQPVSNQFLALNYDSLSAVAFGYSMQPAVLHLVTNHHIHTMTLILKKILELGYRRIGLSITKDWNAKVEHAWQSSLLLFQEQHPGLSSIPIFWDNYEDSELVAWMKTNRPDVVISFNDAMDRLQLAGYKIPDDIGFASPFLSKNETYLTGVHQNDRLIGHKAVDMVIDMLHRGETGIPETPVRMLVEGVWHPGQTLTDRNKAPRSAKRPASVKPRGGASPKSAKKKEMAAKPRSRPDRAGRLHRTHSAAGTLVL